MVVSALAIQYRDVRHAVQFLTQIMMYAAPVVWPFSLFKEKFGESPDSCLQYLSNGWCY